MKLKGTKRRVGKLVFYVVLLGVQAVLIRYLADKQVISTLFSAGAAVHIGPALAALGFVTLRLFIVLFIPGWSRVNWSAGFWTNVRRSLIPWTEI